MRILALIGLGLPLLAVSGAVAYGSIRQISTTLSAPKPVAAVTLTPSVTPDHKAIVQASLSTWALPEAAAPAMAGPAPIVPSAFIGASGVEPDRAPVAVPDANAATIEVAAAPEAAPLLRPRKRAEPKIVVSTGKTRGITPKPAGTPPKPVFKMPWQTGIFQ
jgi:hypothetical protein